jgi:hypothetical protein
MNARAKLAAGVQGGGDFNGGLTGYQEVRALSTSGHGTFRQAPARAEARSGTG